MPRFGVPAAAAAQHIWIHLYIISKFVVVKLHQKLTREALVCTTLRTNTQAYLSTQKSGVLPGEREISAAAAAHMFKNAAVDTVSGP